MIDEKTHLELEKKWKKYHTPYQRWGRSKTRMPLFLKYVDHLKGLNVVEFGCNAGLYGYEIGKVAKSYIGVDRGDVYIKQAKVTKDYFKMENATFMCRPVKGFIRDCQKSDTPPEINGIFASFALYHFSDKETDLIKSYLLPKCKVVLILTRTSKRSPWKKYNSLKLNKIKNVEKYLTGAGFECKSEMHDGGKFGITLAVRKEDATNKGKSDGDKKSPKKTTRRRSTPSVKQGRLPEGSEVLPSERETDAKGPDSILPPVQTGVGGEGLLQGGQREVLPPEPQSGDEGVEEPKEALPVQRDSEEHESGEGEAGPEIREETH